MSEYEIQIYRSMKSPRPFSKRYTYDYQEARKIAYNDVPLNGYQEVLTGGMVISLKGTVFCHDAGDRIYRIWESQSGKTYRYLKKDGSFGKIVKEMM